MAVASAVARREAPVSHASDWKRPVAFQRPDFAKLGRKSVTTILRMVCLRRRRTVGSGQYFAYDVTFDVGQAEIPSSISVCQ